MSDAVVSSLVIGSAPIMAIVNRAADKVIQVIGVTADVGQLASTYLSPTGPVTDINLASIVNGSDGTNGINGVNSITLVGTGNVAESAVVAISAGVRPVTVTVSGVTVGQAYQVVATAAPPAGYALHDAFASAANTLKVNVSAPLLALGQNYSIPVKVYRLA